MHQIGTKQDEYTIVRDQVKRLLLADPLRNSRFFNFIGFKARSLDRGLKSLLLYSIPQGSKFPGIILADSGDEILLCYDSQLHPSPKTMKEIWERFPLSRSLVLHDPLLTSWEKFHQKLQNHWQPRLRTNLLVLDPGNCPEDSCRDLHHLRIKRIDRTDTAAMGAIWGFYKEVYNYSVSHDFIKSLIHRHDFFALCHEKNYVSFAALTRRIPSGRCLSFVYTPQDLRGRSYARFLLTKLLRKAFFEEKYKLIFLYVNAENKVANSMYEDLGFRLFCKSATYRS